LGEKVAYELYPDNGTRPRSIRTLQYNGIIQGIKGYLHQMTPVSKHGPLPRVEPIDEVQPTKDELETALRVLDLCIRGEDQININTPLGDVIGAIQEQLQGDRNGSTARISRPSPSHLNLIPMAIVQRKCYICRFNLLSSHPQYPSLCKPCGNFNLASCSISLPKSLNLKGKTAFVTGGRINLGYHIALRLLRCGAKVLVSTRYPHEAEAKFKCETDSEDWSKSIRIIGADFRSAKDVFHMIELVKDCLVGWSESGDAQLDILINNAAQTLTDSLETEKIAITKEKGSQASMKYVSKECRLLHGNSKYQARIRAGVQASHLNEPDSEHLDLAFETGGTPSVVAYKGDNFVNHLPTPIVVSSMPAETSFKSSWMQSINQIPYEDIISAHSVNTFVPLILVRELLPLMGSIKQPQPTTPSSNTPSKALAYIINVSSREGIFESNPNSSAKQGHHVHTNLTKAALNMLTETEAGPAWRSRRVAMNTVDPGYMSAAPEIMEQWKERGREGCPIGWNDGVGRVLWPIAVGEKGEPVWGRFLKHFGNVEVDVEVMR
jgi:NAD(P)-dependent dehydrogenase (short-subunit alcohol dehydrogenase family)